MHYIKGQRNEPDFHPVIRDRYHMLFDRLDVVKDAVLVLATGLLAEWRHLSLFGGRVVAIAHLSGRLGLGAADTCTREAGVGTAAGVGEVGGGVESWG